MIPVKSSLDLKETLKIERKNKYFLLLFVLWKFKNILFETNFPNRLFFESNQILSKKKKRKRNINKTQLGRYTSILCHLLLLTFFTINKGQQHTTPLNNNQTSSSACSLHNNQVKNSFSRSQSSNQHN